MAVWYCWRCYAKQPVERVDRCLQCGGLPQAPPGATFSDKLLWALGHPLVERRVIAARALGERVEPRALQPLRAMAADPDPYLATAAVRALAHYSHDEVMGCLQAVAQDGPAPARRAARCVLLAGLNRSCDH